MAFGAGEGVNVLIVVLAVFTRHLQFSPDWFGEIRRLGGDFTLAVFFVQSFLHGTLLSVKNSITCLIMLCEVPKLASFFFLLSGA